MRLESIELPELIVQAFFELGPGRAGCDSWNRRAVVAPPRPSQRDGADDGNAEQTDSVRQDPRDPVEALIHGSSEDLLAAILGDECLDDLLAIASVRRELRDLRPHLRR